MRDPHTRDSRGFAFVTMESAEEAEAAIAGLNATEMSGRTMNIQKARRGRARTRESSSRSCHPACQLTSRLLAATPGAYHGPPKREEGGAPGYGGGHRPYEPRGYGGPPPSRYDDRGYAPPPRGYPAYREDRYGPPPGDYGRGGGGGDRYGGGGDRYSGGGGGGGGDRYSGGGGYRDDRGPPINAAPMRDDPRAYDAGMRGGYREERGPPRRDERAYGGRY